MSKQLLTTNFNRMSHSSAQKLFSCPRKYYHYKIAKTPRDRDASSDTHALRYGKMIHEVCEEFAHGEKNTASDILRPFIENKFKEHDLDLSSEYIKAYTALQDYFVLHRKSGLKVAFIEEEVGDENVFGYVDLGLVDRNNYWYISDLKTKGRMGNTLIQSLPEDPQLNLYGYFHRQLAEKHGLDPDKFLGYRYRIIFKSQARVEAKKTLEANMEKFQKLAKSMEVVVPYNADKSHYIYNMYANAHKKTLQARDIKDYACNFANCEQYMSPCEYWSQCHEFEFSEASKRVTVFDTETITDQTFDESDDLLD